VHFTFTKNYNNNHHNLLCSHDIYMAIASRQLLWEERMITLQIRVYRNRTIVRGDNLEYHHFANRRFKHMKQRV